MDSKSKGVTAASQPSSKDIESKSSKSTQYAKSGRESDPGDTVEDDDEDDEESEEEFEDDLPGVNWDRMIPAEEIGTMVKLRWNGFNWKPHRSTFLKGSSSWIGYKEALLTQLRCIGYTPGLKLTPLDEVK